MDRVAVSNNQAEEVRVTDRLLTDIKVTVNVEARRPLLVSVEDYLLAGQGLLI